MSRLQSADKINEPLLIVHDAADSTSGTASGQSARPSQAPGGSAGPIKTARYVMLPREAHGYAVKESVMQTIAEMIEWMDAHVKNAQPRQGAVGRN
jgi:dipeptidyl aminopeptidase/acylaminoacyl peptidase